MNDIRTFFEIINPELMKFRIETYEKTLEKEKNIEIEKIKAEIGKQLESSSKNVKDLLSGFEAMVIAFSAALLHVSHDTRKKLVGDIKNEKIRNTFQGPILSHYKEIDGIRTNLFVKALQEAAKEEKGEI